MRKGISMIELVISIVVMGIVVTSLPMLLSQTQENNAVAMQQEAILATKSRIAGILTYQWDANSIDTTTSPYEKVLDTSTSPDADRDFDTVAPLKRAGHVDGILRRRVHPTNTPTSPNSSEWGNTTIKDIDDFDGKSDSITVIPQDFDFILEIDLSSTVAYIPDTIDINTSNQTAIFSTNVNNHQNNPTNIKMVEVTASSQTNPINLTLRAFATNIGESAPLPARILW